MPAAISPSASRSTDPASSPYVCSRHSPSRLKRAATTSRKLSPAKPASSATVLGASATAISSLHLPPLAVLRQRGGAAGIIGRGGATPDTALDCGGGDRGRLAARAGRAGRRAARAA